VSSSFALVGDGRDSRARVRIRVCDDSSGRIFARVSQRRGHAQRVFARGSFTRTFPGVTSGCRRYRFGWKLRARFVGPGLYVIEIRVRDAEGAWSRPVGPVRSGRR
jgi:hypothetical protein